ncbi:MAG TPA: hypothetical protein VN848_00080 [Gemmatimonadales bacterium]|nr:hypothetical protein [Gemmatimonadales bacterium]
MKRFTSERIAAGALSGLLAGVVVAAWFLIVDLLAGQPLHTPAALASALGHGSVAPSLQLAVTYTVVHMSVFACLGVGAAWALDALDLEPGLWVGLLFGIIVQEFVFYAGLLLSGTAPSTVAPWHHVIGANLLSGVVLMGALARLGGRGGYAFASLRAHPVLIRGTITGLVGAGVVAAWFLLIDLFSGHPFRTPAALGSALLFGGGNADSLDVNLAVVTAYTIVHIVAFVVAGTVFVAIAEQIERSPSMLLLAGMTVMVLEAVVVTIAALGAQWVLGALGVWAIVVGNLLAVAAMSLYVWGTHPTLRHRLSEPVSVRV